MKRTIFEVEQDVNYIFESVGDEYGIEEPEYYGDCLPDEIHLLKIEMEQASSQDEYGELLEEVRKIAEGSASGYLDLMRKEWKFGKMILDFQERGNPKLFLEMISKFLKEATCESGNYPKLTTNDFPDISAFFQWFEKEAERLKLPYYDYDYRYINVLLEIDNNFIIEACTPKSEDDLSDWGFEILAFRRLWLSDGVALDMVQGIYANVEDGKGIIYPGQYYCARIVDDEETKKRGKM